MNTVSLVGRLLSDPELLENENKEKQGCFTLVVARDFKNSEGIYDNDFIPCISWNGIAVATKDYLNKGDVVGVRGRLQVVDNKLIVVADKVTFISSYRKEEN